MLDDENLTEESFCSAGEFVEKRLDEFHDSWQKPNKEPLKIRIHTYADEDFYFRRLIGQGSFSTVHCVFLKEDGFNIASGKYEEAGQGFALKRLRENVIDNDISLKISAADLAIEATVLSSLNHENIIQLHGVKRGNMIESLMNGTFFLVLDLLIETLDIRLNRWQAKQNRSLFPSAASKEATIFKRIRNAALGIGKGMEYLHSMNIMFRDLKPTNIGFDEEDQVKIFDFGLAREISPNPTIQNARLMTGGAGTPRYMAPEVASMSETYGFPADVYSFSILLWQILTTRTPFADILSPTELASKVLKENKRPGLGQLECPDTLKNLMKSGWSTDPLKRPTFSAFCEELEQILTQYEEGNKCDTVTRKGFFKRSSSDLTGLGDVDSQGSTFSIKFLTKQRAVNSHHGGSTLNTSKTMSTSDGDSTTRRVSV